MAKKTKICLSSVLGAYALAYLIYSIVCFKFISGADIIFSVLNQVLLWCVVGLCVFSIFKPAKVEFELSQKQSDHVFLSIAMVAVLLRVFLFTLTPSSLAPDELSMLYESFSLANFGVDRNGYTLPVYLEAWGSGQNALLSYLTIPFVKLFGMNAFSARIVSLLVSTSSVFVFYLILKKLTNTKIALAGFALFAICPWNLIASRWGLESNLFPALVIFAFYFLIKAVKDNHWWLCLSALFWGLALYSYAIAFVFVPLFLICTYIYMFFKKQINWKSFVIANVVLFALAFPLICFVFVNFGWIEPFKIFGVFSVPKLGGFRASEFNLNFTNIIFFLGTFIFQNDFSTWNMCYSFGVTYLAVVPLVIIGFIVVLKRIKTTFKQEFSFDLLICVWAVISVVLGLLMGANINKINIMWPAVFYFAAHGFVSIAMSGRKIFAGICSVLILSLTTFSVCYYVPNNSYNKATAVAFNSGLIESVEFAESLDVDGMIYVSNKDVWEPYIYCLVASETDTNTFVNTVEYEDANVIFRKVLGFSNYRFGFESVTADLNNIYIVKDGDNSANIPQNYKSQRFGYFVVYYAAVWR